MAGEDGLRAGFKAGTPYIDLSTNSPALVRELSADLAEIGVSMLDAPVSGGPKGAASRKLAIWVSGEKATYDACKPILDLLGDQVRYLGASGNASVAKLVHNCANYGIQMVLAEAFTLGVKAGVDPVALFGAIRQGSLGRQRAVDRMADQFLPHEFDNPAFALELAHKDVVAGDGARPRKRRADALCQHDAAEMTEALNKGWGKRDSRAGHADPGRTRRPRHPRSPQRVAGHSQERAALIRRIGRVGLDKAKVIRSSDNHMKERRRRKR